MGIKRTVEWKLTCSAEDADARLRRAFTELDMTPDGPPRHVTASAKRSLMKNRWAAEAAVDIEPAPWGATAICTVDMAGNKHYELLGDIAEAVGEDVFDDRGVNAAVERLGKASRIFGRKEIRHLRNLLHAHENVVELGQGRYGDKQGLVVLTTQRLFFFEKSLGSETVEEFDLALITSLGVGKKMGGEVLQVHAAGNNAEIKQMMHGQAEAVARAFRTLKNASAAPATEAVVDDPIAQLERLATLRDKGILSDAEFEAKKAELISRM